MPRKRKRVREPNPENLDEIRIEDFICSFLILAGLKKNRDFSVSSGQLFIKKFPARGKLLEALKYHYPQYNYYWETPRILQWF